MNKVHQTKVTPTLTTPKAASRVQAADARTSGGGIAKGSRTARMQAAATKNFGKPGAK
jgi:hypothetical protein